MHTKNLGYKKYASFPIKKLAFYFANCMISWGTTCEIVNRKTCEIFHFTFPIFPKILNKTREHRF